MSQYQPPQSPQGVPGQYGAPQNPSGEYGQASQAPVQDAYGQASQAPGAYGQPAGYPQHGQQPGQPAQQGQYGQEGPHGQQGQYGQPGQQGFGGQYGGAPYPTAPGGPGLFDTEFAQPSTLKTAKLAYIAIIVLAGVLAVGGLFNAIGQFWAFGPYGSVGSLLGGIVSLVSGAALGFVVLTVGRLFVDYFVQQAKALESTKSEV
ncbi:DUF4282 domain-containing protein [Occultella glacieicola]|uniref:DUF4282 domain-containing protein n=1 Tax=Occultella glacieicola TaxID=2518684 RepID=A0ABY2DYS7_9MICO|nr:DUF4282 domain-containing protein [Occultella glacieicola]TDE89645.1 DUF4282 domain-containing protein [Occultella glacieicola]